MSQSECEPSRAAEPASGREASAAGTLRLPAQPSYLGLIGLFVRWFGDRAGLSSEKCHELEVAVDEVCTNVIRHASGPGTAGWMTVVCTPFEEGLRVTVADHGRPFDPAEAARIAERKRSEDPASGGMGLLLVRRLTDAGAFGVRTFAEGGRARPGVRRNGGLQSGGCRVPGTARHERPLRGRDPGASTRSLGANAGRIAATPSGRGAKGPLAVNEGTALWGPAPIRRSRNQNR